MFTDLKREVLETHLKRLDRIARELAQVRKDIKDALWKSKIKPIGEKETK